MSILTALALTLAGVTPPTWTGFAPGIEHASLEVGAARLEALRFDPRRVAVRVVLARELGRPAATAHEFVAGTGAVAAVNGGFFDPELRPIGLRVANGVASGRVRDGMGALAVFDSGEPTVRLGRDLGPLGQFREVVQCAPRLVVAGQPNRLKPQVSRRTAAGVDRAGRLVLVVTRTGELEAGELARRLAAAEADGGFALRDALNLDGGGSSQLYARSAQGELDVPGLTPVADALVIGAPPRP